MSDRQIARPKYIYHYFNAQARGETVRLVLAEGDIEYVDRRIDFSEWPGDFKAKLPFGKVPVLEVDGEYIDQSVAITRYLAREAGLAGSTSLESFKIDAVAETINEIREKVIPILFLKDEDEKKTKLAEYIKTTNEVLNKLEDYLKANKGGDGFFVGDKMSWADLHLVVVAELVARAFPDVLKNYPKLSALDKRVRAQPKIANYIAKRPKTMF